MWLEDQGDLPELAHGGLLGGLFVKSDAIASSFPQGIVFSLCDMIGRCLLFVYKTKEKQK